jgi:hypothetical protein
MTSLNMPGFSITVLLLPGNGDKPYSSEQILGYLDSPASAPGWGFYSAREPGSIGAQSSEGDASEEPKAKEVDLARESSVSYISSVADARFRSSMFRRGRLFDPLRDRPALASAMRTTYSLLQTRASADKQQPTRKHS